MQIPEVCSWAVKYTSNALSYIKDQTITLFQIHKKEDTRVVHVRCRERLSCNMSHQTCGSDQEITYHDMEAVKLKTYA